MLDKYRVSQIKALLAEGHGIKTVAGMTGVSRNTVRRFQRNSPLKSHHGLAWGRWRRIWRLSESCSTTAGETVLPCFGL